MSKFQEIKLLVASLEADADKVYDKKNRAAAVRVRTGLQQLKTLAQEAREEVLAIKNRVDETVNG